jgi:peptide/nickel transport system permease protein
MRNYAIKRLLLLIPTIILFTIAMFLALQLMPGNYVDALVIAIKRQDPSAVIDVEQLKHEFGLDRPLIEQYMGWLGGVFRGELGVSMLTGKSATQEMLKRIPVTVELNLLAFIITWLIAIPVGIYSALSQDTFLDYLGRGFTVLGMSLPDFWVATMLFVFAVKWLGWVPQVVYIPFTQDPIGNLKQFIIPALIMSLPAGSLVRTLRTLTLEVIKQDYVRTAWGKGLSERVIIFRHALRNAMIPLNSMLIPAFLGMLGGSVIMENIFSLPGMGRYLLSALVVRDWPIVLGTNLFFTVLGLITIVIVDLSYAWADPRIRYD